MPELTWQGYLRKDGRKGIRNLILIVYTVECASFVAHGIGQSEDDVHVIGFPGCYDNAYAIRMMIALITHPNVGACLAVGLGCEYTQPAKLAEAATASGRPADWFYIQQEGGTRLGVSRGKSALQSLREQMAKDSMRVPMSWADLTVGAECGGSDGTSGLSGNPVVGRFFDHLVDKGGTAVFEEVVEMIGLQDVLHSRAANEAVAKELDETYRKRTARLFASIRFHQGTLPAASRPSKRKAWAHLPSPGAAQSRASCAYRSRRLPQASGCSTPFLTTTSCSLGIPIPTTRKGSWISSQ